MRWDNVRLGFQPTAGNEHTLLQCAPKIAPYLVPEKLLWEESGPNGRFSRVKTIRVNLSADAIEGLVLIYDCGMIRSIGALDREEHTVWEPQGDVVRLDVHYSDKSVTQLSVSEDRTKTLHG